MGGVFYKTVGFTSPTQEKNTEDFFMKKIVSAAVAAGLLASAAFADVSFSYENKNYFKAGTTVGTTALNSSGASKQNTTVEKGNRKFGYVGSEQNVSLTMSNDLAGAHIAFNLKSTNGKVTTNKATNTGTWANEIDLDDYYGWMNFSKIHTTITAGAWNARWVDLCDDDGVGDDQDFALFKPGVIVPGDYRSDWDTTGNQGDYNVAADSDNLTRGNLAMVAAYTMSIGPGTLLAKLGLVDVTGKSPVGDKSGAYGFDGGNSTWTKALGGGWINTYDSESLDDGGSTTIFYSGFAGELAFRADNLFAVNLAVRSYEAHTASFGLFFSPLMIENLRATAGVTVGLNASGYNKTKHYDYIYKDEGTIGVEWAIDLRLRYQITDRLAFTTLNNFSSYLDRLMVDTGDTDTTKWTTNDFALWNQVNLTYDFADNLTAGFTLQHLDTDLDQQYTQHNHLYFAPNLVIHANDNLELTLIARSHWQNIGSKESVKYDFTLPVIFKVNY